MLKLLIQMGLTRRTTTRRGRMTVVLLLAGIGGVGAHPVGAACLQWTRMAPMPTKRNGLAAVTMGGTVYAVGGSQGSPVATLEAYDPATNSWTSKMSMPTPRGALAAAVV